MPESFRHAGSLANALGVLAVAMLAADCVYGATAVQVIVDTDAPDDRTITIRATIERRSSAGTAGGMHSFTRGPASSVALPASFTVVPHDDEPRDDELTMTLEAVLEADGPSRPVLTFRRRAQFRFTPRVTTAIRVFLPMSCADPSSECTSVASSACSVSVRCEETGMTCGDHGECVAAAVTPLPVADGGAVIPPRDVVSADIPVVRRDDGALIDAALETAADVARDIAMDVPPADTGCTTGSMQTCYTGPLGTAGRGPCVAGMQRCTAGSWEPCMGEITPRAEVCFDRVDDDCNGRPDDGCPTQRSCVAPTPAGCGTVDVPAGGPFPMGQVGAEFATPVQPAIRITQPFRIDAYEVTLARFRRFWVAGHPMPPGPIVYPALSIPWGGTVVTEPVDIAGQGCNWTTTAATREAHPLNCVDWYTAQAFCVWDGGRLPTEAEYEWTARYRPVTGLSPGRTYPWGEAVPVGVSGGACDRAQWNLCLGDDGAITRRVGAFTPSGGIFDLVGNLSEWSADAFRNYSTTLGATCWDGTARDNPLCRTVETANRARRSGSAGSNTTARIRAATRDQYAVTIREDQLGFRCAQTM